MKPRRQALGPLGRRLAAAFLLVAVVAIGVFAILTVVAARSEVSGITSSSRRDDLHATAVAAADAYHEAGSWKSANLSGAAALAARSQATLTVLDAAGNVVAAPTDALATMMMHMHGLAAVSTPRGEPVSAEVVVEGRSVGSVQLRFPADSMAAEQHVREALARNAMLGIGLAALVAFIVALVVSRWVTTPVRALTAATSRFADGERNTRVATSAPGELGTLARSFNAMADHLDREDQLRRNLVADVAHELRTPLAILQGSCEALVDGVDAPTPAVFESLHEEIVRLGRIVGDLETLASAEAAGLRLDLEEVDVNDVVMAAADLMKPLAAERRVQLVTDLRPTPIRADQGRLQQIVLNLVSNSLKFAPEGGHIWISLTSDSAKAVLIVSDDGPGIAESDRPHVFERFWRSTAHSVPGSGIGLAVVKELVEAHDGSVTVGESAQGGAEFVVEFPR